MRKAEDSIDRAYDTCYRDCNDYDCCWELVRAYDDDSNIESSECSSTSISSDLALKIPLRSNLLIKFKFYKEFDR